MPRVYVINKSSHDFSQAEDWGEIVYLSTGLVDRFEVNQMYRLFAEALNGSSPDDYILPTGLSIMGLIAASIFARKHGRLNLLLFKDGGYIERRLDIDALITVEEE